MSVTCRRHSWLSGFDAHVNDPLGMGGLSAAEFRSVTEVACHMATRACSGRIISVFQVAGPEKTCFCPIHRLMSWQSMTWGLISQVT